jgi:glutamyl-Q tRNA(Asp) synthetase
MRRIGVLSRLRTLPVAQPIGPPDKVNAMDKPVFRFAPSPNGHLHLGHAYSALLNARLASESNGRFLLRIEDIDLTRAAPDLIEAIYADLAWLGLDWEKPVRQQSRHLPQYQDAVDRLAAQGLIYPSVLSRTDIRRLVDAFEADGRSWPRDPLGSPLYPGTERELTVEEHRQIIGSGRSFSLRLNMAAALSCVGTNLTWQETGNGPDGETGVLHADPAAWGDVILSRSDAPGSYHLAVVVDDAAQGVTDVVRGQDLFHATAIHRVLQVLLELPEPRYRHHPLILAADGKKLAKSRGDTSIHALREAGATAASIRSQLGF